MPSQAKLIKQGINYSDKLFQEIINRLTKGVKYSDTLESFLAKTKDYTISNPLVTTGYDAKMLEIILQETNNHKFSRPAQKELTRITIENKVGELIRGVGDDIKADVRDIVKHGYDNNLSQDEIAANITKKITTINNTRARAIARTEIARTATISDYVISAERGATHFKVECRNTACEVCKRAWLSNPERTAIGKGMEGDIEYSMANDTKMLPPLHPNCRCVAYFFKKENEDNQELKVDKNYDSNRGNKKFSKKINKYPEKVVKIKGKESHGIGESKKDKAAFGEKYGINYTEMTNDEIKFIKLYSGDGFEHLNTYLRQIVTIEDPKERNEIYLELSKKWDSMFKGDENYMPLGRAIKIGQDLFKKGKILEDDLVVVRRQNGPMIKYAKNGIYKNDAYLSTSISIKITKYGEDINLIRIPKGERILYIEKVTDTEGEYEVLLPPGIEIHLLDEHSEKLHTWTL